VLEDCGAVLRSVSVLISVLALLACSMFAPGLSLLVMAVLVIIALKWPPPGDQS
jgi:hypothetical protein